MHFEYLNCSIGFRRGKAAALLQEKLAGSGPTGGLVTRFVRTVLSKVGAVESLPSGARERIPEVPSKPIKREWQYPQNQTRRLRQVNKSQASKSWCPPRTDLDMARRIPRGDPMQATHFEGKSEKLVRMCRRNTGTVPECQHELPS